MLLFDIHLDLAMNAMEWNRDLRMPLDRIRQSEGHLHDKPDRGNNTVSFPEMRKGQVHLCVATLIARYANLDHPFPGWSSPEQAWAQTQAQLAWYKSMEEAGELAGIKTQNELTGFLQNLETRNNNEASLGYILSLEGADSILTFKHLERNFEAGLRLLGPAHYGPGIYAPGTESTGPLTRKGQELLKAMDDLGMILDSTHLTDEGFQMAFDQFKGPIWASHCLCRHLTPLQRQISNEQIRMLLERGGVIGMAFDAWMMVPHWQRGKSTPEGTGLTLDKIAEHIDHLCQIAGHTRQCAIGSDLDGGFGMEQCPMDLNSISDLQKIETILSSRGYEEEDISNIFYQNAVRFLEENLP